MGTIYIIIIHTVGLICLAYLARYIIQDGIRNQMKDSPYVV